MSRSRSGRQSPVNMKLSRGLRTSTVFLTQLCNSSSRWRRAPLVLTLLPPFTAPWLACALLSRRGARVTAPHGASTRRDFTTVAGSRIGKSEKGSMRQ